MTFKWFKVVCVSIFSMLFLPIIPIIGIILQKKMNVFMALFIILAASFGLSCTICCFRRIQECYLKCFDTGVRKIYPDESLEV